MHPTIDQFDIAPLVGRGESCNEQMGSADMPSPKISITLAARNMIASLQDYQQEAFGKSDEILQKVQKLVLSPSARRVEGYVDLFYAADRLYVVVFEKHDDEIVVKSVGDSRQDWRQLN